ncbi:MAG: T9SS type A sorting domain-containing protein [Ignavibacteria bacterium]|nr:T9SS type A sorting domain-containing protein [Ignavibacteria bacterium]
MKKLNLAIFFLFVFTIQSLAATDTLRVMNWNLLNFAGTDTFRVQYYRTVISNANPDIFICQEISGPAANGVLYNQVFQSFAPGVYDTVVFNMGPDTGNLLFYKKSKAKFISNTPIRTALRDISEFKMYMPFIQDTVRFFSCHLKASSGSANEILRGKEVDTLRYYTNQLPLNKFFILAGDFNIYSANEAAYQKLLAVTTGEGQFFDPIPNMTGNWNGVAAYAFYHTQSPRVRSFGGGATGGMDDRFDMLLHSKAISNAGSKFFFSYSTTKYFTYGNDGNHFNDSINKQPNTAAPVDVVNGIHYASDHCPVIAKYVLTGTSGIISTGNEIPSGFSLSQNFPNPFNPVTTIGFGLPVSAYVTLKVYDLTGREVLSPVNEQKPAGNFAVTIDASALPSGTYIYRFTAGNYTAMKKMILLK